MLSLFPEEHIITQSSEGAVTITTHRICYEYKEVGRSYNQSIMLEHITSCENRYITQVWLLVLGGLFIALGLMMGSTSNPYNNHNSMISLFILLALICGALYLSSRRSFITIASPSTKMKINAAGMKKQQVLDFINKVELTKHKRISELNNRSTFTS